MWQKINNYYMKNDEWTICKVKVNKITMFELWHKSKSIEQSIENLTAAIDKHEELTK